MKINPKLGTCYYPEHWPSSLWAEDARRMRELGISWVRVGEFAWSRFEPQPEVFDFAWMDEAVGVLADAGLKIIMCTPTATPPRWMLDKHPDMLAVDENGNPRKFGSRRHYCFSHTAYLQESKRIAALIGERYGDHSSVCAWQIDNEYSCHETTRSYSPAALSAFQSWLHSRYKDIDSLNQAWGNVFWSMEYSQFAQIDLPNMTVTEPNPAHVLDFYRFSSDQVVKYNKAQADVLRQHTQAPLIHNYMGRIVDFDHYKVGDDLDIASWDSYPLGFLVDRSGTSQEWQKRFERQGDPDLQAFHHDLYRRVGHGRWWVMEQQPGPVNWAPNNPAPLPGMVKLWTLEAIAHQAEVVSYFRWRQAPFAQEQMHAGLLRPDSQESAVYPEVKSVTQELKKLGELQFERARVALVFDYESCWAWEVQPQGKEFDAFALCFDFYRGLRRLGLNVDILPPDDPTLSSYQLKVVPGLFAWPSNWQFEDSGLWLLGPRSGSKTKDFQIPAKLAPNINELNCRVAFVESFRSDNGRELDLGGQVNHWMESLEGDFEVLEKTVDGAPVLVAKNNIQYLGGWPDAEAMQRILARCCRELGIHTTEMPEGVRQRVSIDNRFIFNFNTWDVEFEGERLEPASVRVVAVK